MNRKQIIAAGVGAELFYITSDGRWGWTYRAVVRSVEPVTTNRGARNRGVEVCLWDEDNHQGHDPSWRVDAETGKRYKNTRVDAARLKGDWESWRKEQLAQRARDKAERDRKDAARDLALDTRGKINTAIGEELQAKLGRAETGHYQSDGTVEMPAALALELLAGWQWALAENSDPASGDLVDAPWRDVKAGYIDGYPRSEVTS